MLRAIGREQTVRSLQVYEVGIHVGQELLKFFGK